MSQEIRKIIKGSTALAIAQMVANIAAFLLPWAIARGMGEIAYGLYATAYALAVSMASIADTGIRVTLIREVSRAPMFWQPLVRHALIISVIIGFFVGLFFFISSSLESDSEAVVHLRLWLFSYALLWVIMRISLAVVVGHQRIVTSAIWGVIERVGGTLVVLLIVFSPGVNLIMIAQSLVCWEMFIIIALWWWLLQQPWETEQGGCTLLEFATVAVPFGVSAVAYALYSKLDLIILGFHQMPEQIAMYAAGQTLSYIFVFAGVAIGSTLFPKLSSLAKNKDIDGAKALITPSVSLLAFGMLFCSSVVAVLADSLVVFIYGEPFQAAATWLIIFVLLSPILAINSIVGSVISSWGRQADYARLTVGLLLASLPLYWLFSSWFGMYGLAFCVILTQLILALRMWAWLVEDGLVKDSLWMFKVFVLELLITLGVFFMQGSWVLLSVLLAVVGSILLRICSISLLLKMKSFMLPLR